jgi:hypothetical protein
LKASLNTPPSYFEEVFKPAFNESFQATSKGDLKLILKSYFKLFQRTVLRLLSKSYSKLFRKGKIKLILNSYFNVFSSYFEWRFKANFCAISSYLEELLRLLSNSFFKLF